MVIEPQPDVQGFAQYWSTADLRFRGLVCYSQDQAPLPGCVCCPGEDSIRFSSRKERYHPKKPVTVNGLAVAEIIISDLQDRFASRVSRSLSDRRLWDLEDAKTLYFYFTSIWVPWKSEILKLKGYSDEEIQRINIDPVSRIMELSDIENAPIPIQISRRARHSAAVHEYRYWTTNADNSLATSIRPRVADGIRYAVRAGNLKQGFTHLRDWLARGIVPNEAHRDLAEIAAHWIYGPTYYGARNGASKVKVLAERLHGCACEQHREFIDSVFR